MKQFFRSKLCIGLLALATLLCGVIGFQHARAAASQDCSANSIMTCGAQTPQQFVDNIRANKQTDLGAIYTYAGLPASKYDDFVQHAKTGTAFKNGDVTVGGQTVMTNAYSIGRSPQSFSTNYAIAGNTYYKSQNQDIFLSDSIPAMVYFDGNGKVQFAVLTSCGNPVGGTPVTPSFSCDLLQKTAVQGQANTFQFTTKATAANGAMVDHVVYDFGDGSPTVTMNSLTEAATHTYSKAGNFTAKVTVFVKSADGMHAVVSNNCQTQIIVQAAPMTPTQQPASFQCTGLAAIRSNDDMTFVFRATAATSSATLSSADFDFGDGSVSNSVGPESTSALSAAVTHSYGRPGAYTAKATLHFTLQDQNGATMTAAASCQTAVNIQQPAAVTTAVTPPAPAPTQAPATMPDTGPGGVAGLFTGASAVGALGYRVRSQRRLRRTNQAINRMLGLDD